MTTMAAPPERPSLQPSVRAQGARMSRGFLPVRNEWLILIAVLLAPLALLLFLALPQGEDFCFYVAAHLRSLPQIIDVQYHHVSARIVATVLSLAPDMIGRAARIPVSYLYVAMLIAAFAAFLACAWVLADRLMPRVSSRTRLFLSLLLCAVLAGHAPSVRGLMFWWPGIVSFTLPGLALAFFMAVLYRAMADRRWIEAPTAWSIAILMAAVGLCNEAAGLMTAAVAGISFFARRHLRMDSQPLLHLVFVAIGLGCALVIGLAPGTWDRSESARYASSLLWGGGDEAGVAFRSSLRWLGVVGWLGILAAIVVQFPPPQRKPDTRHVGALVGFGVGATFASMLITWLVAAHWGWGHWNQHHIFSVIALSLPTVLVARYYGPWALQQLTARRIPAPGVLVACLILAMASPGVIGAFVQMPGAWVFQRESRERFRMLAQDNRALAYLPLLSARPGLLADADLSTSGKVPPNICIAKLFDKRAVIGEPR